MNQGLPSGNRSQADLQGGPSRQNILRLLALQSHSLYLKEIIRAFLFFPGVALATSGVFIELSRFSY